jgi:exodeoxyribonuclease-5
MSGAGRLFDFGYALTCHKAQGSEFDFGMIYLDQRPRPGNDDWHRWGYTAVTRAKGRLVIFHDD